MYFELDEVTGSLIQSQNQFYEVEVRCMDIGEVPEGRKRCKFLVVGFADSTGTLRILSLEPETCLQRISTQALPSVAHSVTLMALGSRDPESKSSDDNLYLHVGLENGVLLRYLVDNVTGALSDSRQQFLGTKAIKLSKVVQKGQESIVALSNRPWLCYKYMGQYRVTPLSYDSLSHANAFSSERCPEGIVAIADNTLRIFSVEHLGDQFTQKVIRTRYTPCKF